MSNVKVYLKGWRNGALYADAVNRPNHSLHAEAEAIFNQAFRAYEPGHTMHLAFEYVTPERAGWPESEAEQDRAVCNEAFEWFNVGENEIARRYRSKHNRSLSVGDVLVIDGRAYGCASVGWTRIENFTPTLSEL